jgi:hypothetical protein
MWRLAIQAHPYTPIRFSFAFGLCRVRVWSFLGLTKSQAGEGIVPSLFESVPMGTCLYKVYTFPEKRVCIRLYV